MLWITLCCGHLCGLLFGSWCGIFSYFSSPIVSFRVISLHIAHPSLGRGAEATCSNRMSKLSLEMSDELSWPQPFLFQSCFLKPAHHFLSSLHQQEPEGKTEGWGRGTANSEI